MQEWMPGDRINELLETLLAIFISVYSLIEPLVYTCASGGDLLQRTR